jgi:nucleotide-binding universal stress UspA family protein
MTDEEPRSKEGDPPTAPASDPSADGRPVIIVGFDGSPTSAHAGAYAAGIARRQNARLLVVFVQATSALSLLAPEHAWQIEENLAAVTEDLRRQVAAGSGYTGVDVEFITVRGDPYAELCRIATQVRADAVVVGSSTHAGHRILGSLAIRLVRAGRWPVTVVP